MGFAALVVAASGCASSAPPTVTTPLAATTAAAPPVARGPAHPDYAALRSWHNYYRVVAEQILLHRRHVIGKKPGRHPEEEGFIVSMQGIVEGCSEGG